MAIEREEIERLAKDRDDERAILDRNVYGRLADFLKGKQAAGVRKVKDEGKLTEAVIEDVPARSGGRSPVATKSAWLNLKPASAV